jgi:hypothetical protein
MEMELNHFLKMTSKYAIPRLRSGSLSGLLCERDLKPWTRKKQKTKNKKKRKKKKTQKKKNQKN